MKFKIPLLIIFLFTFSITISAQTKKTPDSWRQFSECGLIFDAPETFKKTKQIGFDCYLEDSADSDNNIKMAIAYSSERRKFEKDHYTLDFKVEAVELDGKKAQLFTYTDTSEYDGYRNYIAGLQIETSDTPNSSINIIISGRREKDLEMAKKIFKSIKFQT